MDIQEMHVWFRQYAQQMGMQNVRAILPEQIDVVINTSISDTVNELVRTSVGLTNDRIITDNSKLSQINALRTLFKSIDLEPNITDITKQTTAYKVSPFMRGTSTADTVLKKALYLVDISVRYLITKGTNTSETDWYPVRLIDNMYLADTLQDYILRPTPRSPIAVIYGDERTGTDTTKDVLEVYFGKDLASGEGILKDRTLGNPVFRINYIATPKKVVWANDWDSTGNSNVDCDLPAYMHVDILKHAVDLYRVSVQGSLYANQQQQQAQQREVGRNNVRPDNEGYTQ